MVRKISAVSYALALKRHIDPDFSAKRWTTGSLPGASAWVVPRSGCEFWARRCDRRRRGKSRGIVVRDLVGSGYTTMKATHTHSHTTEHCIDVCNRLLRGEISAVETYTQAIAKFRNEPEVSVLEDLRREHIESANRLRANVHEMGGSPSNDSGAWGTWAKAVEGAAKLMGDTVALKALLEGEEHGEKDYRDALDDDGMMPEHKAIIESELLPRQLRHISVLRDLIRVQ